MSTVNSLPDGLLGALASAQGLHARNRVVFGSIHSTNEVGKAISAAYLRRGHPLPPTILLATQQTDGRGRLGNRWHSPPGGIYVSYLWPCRELDELQLLPLRVALALCRPIDQLTCQPCRVKWPNDLVVQERKLGGILIETVMVSESIAAVVGFGINYARAAAGIDRSVALEDVSSRPPSLAEVVLRLVLSVERELESKRAAEEVVAECLERSLHRPGETLRCRTADRLVEGEFLGFDAAGLLRLQTTAGETKVSSGEVLEQDG